MRLPSQQRKKRSRSLPAGTTPMSEREWNVHCNSYHFPFLTGFTGVQCHKTKPVCLLHTGSSSPISNSASSETEGVIRLFTVSPRNASAEALRSAVIAFPHASTPAGSAVYSSAQLPLLVLFYGFNTICIERNVNTMKTFSHFLYCFFFFLSVLFIRCFPDPCRKYRTASADLCYGAP